MLLSAAFSPSGGVCHETEHRTSDGRWEEMQLGRYVESRLLRALNDDLRRLNFMGKPSVHFVNHQRSLSRQLTYSYLCVRRSFWQPVKDGIKLESKGTVRKKFGADLTWGRKGGGRYGWHCTYITMERTKLVFPAYWVWKVSPTKANQFCFHYTSFQNVTYFWDWLRFPKDIVLTYVFCIYIIIFLCHSLLSSVAPNRKHKPKYRCLQK